MDCLAHITQILYLLKITKFTLIYSVLNLLSKFDYAKCPLRQSELVLLNKTFPSEEFQWAECNLLDLLNTVIQNELLEPIINSY